MLIMSRWIKFECIILPDEQYNTTQHTTQPTIRTLLFHSAGVRGLRHAFNGNET